MSDFNLIGGIKIDAGNSNDVIKNLNAHIEVLATRLKDTEDKAGRSTNALRGFFREQRLQDRGIREGIQSITSLALVFNTLGGNSSEATKKLGESLSTAAGVMNSMEFAGFGLQQMGKSVGGSFGALAGKIGGLLGPIGMVVGVGAGLLQFFDDSKEKAEEARIEQEKLKKSLNELKEAVSNFNKLALGNLTEEGMKQAKAQWQGWADEGGKAVKNIEGDLKGMKKDLSAAELEAKTIFKIGADKQKSVVKTSEEKQADIDKVNNLKTAIKLAEDKLVITKKDYEWNKLNAEETDKVLKNLELAKKAEKTTGGFEHKPEDKKTGKTPEEIAKDEYDAKMANYALELDTQKLEVKRAEFSKDENKIQEQRNKLIEIYNKILKGGLSPEDRIRFEEQLFDFEKGIADEKEQNTQKQIDKETKFADFKKDLITNEIDQVNEAEKDKLKILEQAIDDGLVAKEDAEKIETQIHEEAAKKRTEINDREANKIKDIEKQLSDRKLQIMNASFDLAISFAKKGSDLQKGLALTQIATNLAIGYAQGLDIAQKGAVGTGPLAPYSFPLFYTQQVLAVLGAIGQAKNALGFAQGGFTGEGGRYEEAGVVHKGEVVFEKPLVDKYKNPLLQLRSMMQNGGSYVPYNTNGYDMGTQRELKALRSDMNVFMKQDRNLNVNLRGTMKGQKFLKDEMPKHNKFTKNKYV